MSDLLGLRNVRYNSGEEFINRVEAACAIAAQAVLAEDAATNNHANRVTWAQGVFRSTTGSRAAAEAMMWIVVANPTIRAALVSGQNVTDNDVQYVVNNSIDIFAV